MEIWRNAPGFEGLYQVSNEGRVKSLARVIVYKDGRKKILKEKILENVKNDLGYYTVQLYKNGEKSRKKVHRLVAQAFISNPHGYTEVNHKDEDKTNNTVWVNDDGSVDFEKSNLEWCTHKYNINYGTRNERMKEKLFNRPDIAKAVGQYTLDDVLIETFKSVSEVERKHPEFKTTSVSRCCRGGQMLNGKWQTITSYKNYKWKFI